MKSLKSIPSLSGPSLSGPSLSGPSLSGPSLSGPSVECDATPLWDDMRSRWESGDRARVEDYLNSGKCDPRDERLLVDLIYAEFNLREASGEAPRLEEYLARFPAVEGPLRRQWEVHWSLADESAWLEETVATAGKTVVSASRSPCPQSVGKYHIVASLGSGSQADVYRGVHPVLGMDVIVKVSRHSFRDDASQCDRLVSEGKILAELEHPNIARVHDLDVYEDRPFLVMEYVTGLNLEQYAKRETITAERAAELVSKIARAVAAAHRKGVTHRDIKPRNIIVDESGEPHVIDFGLSQFVDAWTPDDASPGGISGTLAYMAPEQARTEGPAVDHRVDIFALGGVLVYLLTGQPLYAGTSARTVLQQVRDGQWNQEALVRADVPARLRAICQKALATDREQRYSLADRLADELDRFVVTCTLRRRIVPIAAGLAILLVLIGFAAIASFRNRGNTPPIADGDLGRTSRADTTNNATKAAEPWKLAPLGVQVWRGDRYYDLIDVAPIGTGDRLRIHADLPAGMHASLFLVDSNAVVSLLAQEPPRTSSFTLRYPSDESQAAPLAGPSGTEFVFLCVSRSGAIDLSHIQPLWQSTGEWATLPELTVLSVQPDGVRVSQGTRGLGAAVNQRDPEGEVRKQLDQFRQRLGSACDTFDGVAFSHR